MTELEDLQIRMRVVVLETCNAIGCTNCDLKWDDGCSATDLQNKIMDLEMKDEHQQKT